MTATDSGSADFGNILQFNSLLNGGGTDDQCVKLAHALKRLGQPVFIAGPEARNFAPVIRSAGIPFYPTPPEGFLKLRLIVAAAKFIHEKKINIVHAHHGRDYWPAILAAWLSGRRPRVILSRHLASSPKSFPSRWVILDSCDALIAVSEFTARILREGVTEPGSPDPERVSRPPIYGDKSKILVAHGGIDTERFHPMDATALRAEWGLQPGDYAFAVVGSYDPPRGKGQREFLEAAARIQSAAPNARFVIIGRGGMGDVLRADIARLGLQGKAWLAPWTKDMPKAMNAIDCLVHPAIGTESFGLVLLEAFASGKPVIASALDGIPEAHAVGNYGRLVKPGSVEELSAAMLEWSKRPGLSPTESAAMHQKIAETHSLPAYGKRILECYRKAVG
jgi:glycosyltransferase involved in cell wall biosynthesis